MPRPKKDGKMLNLYIDKKAVERLLTKALDIEENKKD